MPEVVASCPPADAFAFPRNFHREICVPPLRLDSRRDLELFVPFSVSDFFSGTESVRNREQMQTLGTAAELVIHLRTFSRLEGGKGKPATPRRARTLRKHRHVTRSPAASHPVVARCTASCRPLPSPPARYASRPRPHLSAKLSRERLLERGRMRIEASFRDGRVPKTGAPEDARAPTRGDRRTGSVLNNRGCHPRRRSPRRCAGDAVVSHGALEATRLKFPRSGG